MPARGHAPHTAKVRQSEHAGPRVPRVLRRCLGPRKREHYFPSCGPAERICPECRKRVDALHLSPVRARAVATPPGLE